MSIAKKLMVCFGLTLALSITGWSMAEDKAPAAPTQPAAKAPVKAEGKEVKKEGKKKEADNDDVQEEHEDKHGGQHEGKEADDD